MKEKEEEKLHHASNEIKCMNTKRNETERNETSLFHMFESLACWECIFGLVWFMPKIVRTHAQQDDQFICGKRNELKRRKKNAIDEMQTNTISSMRDSKKTFTHCIITHMKHGFAWKSRFSEKCRRKESGKKRFAFTNASIPFLHSIPFSRAI